MALNTSKCNHLTPLPFKGLTVGYRAGVEERGSRDAGKGRRVEVSENAVG